jgi:Cdc6-like AAA superfamily ATPase
MLDDLYKPDQRRLNVLITGRPGSGKSYFIKHTLLAFMKKWKDPNGRVVYVDPKMEVDLGENTMTTVEGLEKHLQKNRIAVIYPETEYVEQDTDDVIDTVYQIQEANPDFKGVILVDDAQTFLSSRRAASYQFKRLALTGRSKNLRFVGVAHMMVFSKDLEGSISYLVNFSMPVKLYHKDAMVRYGFDASEYAEELSERPYSFVWFDVTAGTSRLMAPIDVKGESQAERRRQTEPSDK